MNRIKPVLFFLFVGLFCTTGKYLVDRSASLSSMPRDFRDAPADIKDAPAEDSWFMILKPSPKKQPKIIEKKDLDNAVAQVPPAGMMMSGGPMGYSYAVPFRGFDAPDRSASR